ncbi:patatin family protein [Acinetobacter sp. ME22]|uniref:patatin-like phospholipase family protein n=1 Tax=Acinetobacter sp. ME22 TaxID=2904802 RepID=UPI001EDAC496|nr:patatin family protein [Acinetobacter sp. ME22]MCG2573098.1 patatin family protein [Acinetobacter sp. ME22]
MLLPHVYTLIIEGGGMRSAFSTGVIDAFLTENFNPFHHYVGVSSGSTTLASYLSKQKGRNLEIFLDQTLRPEFIQFKRFLKGGDLMDVKWMWDVLEQENPLDLDALFQNHPEFYIVLTHAHTGQAHYQRAQPETILETLRASSSIPFLTRQPVWINEQPFFDGGVADALPVQWAAQQPRVDALLVIRTRPKNYAKAGKKADAVISRFVKHQGFAQSLKQRAERYNQSVQFLREQQPQKILEINPPHHKDMADRMCQDPKRLRYSYQVGIEAGYRAMQDWKMLLND